jgi:hypothetical protein
MHFPGNPAIPSAERIDRTTDEIRPFFSRKALAMGAISGSLKPLQ